MLLQIIRYPRSRMIGRSYCRDDMSSSYKKYITSLRGDAILQVPGTRSGERRVLFFSAACLAHDPTQFIKTASVIKGPSPFSRLSAGVSSGPFTLSVYTSIRTLSAWSGTRGSQLTSSLCLSLSCLQSYLNKKKQKLLFR